MAHDGPLVALSFAVALFASYTALDMGSRLRQATGKARWLWLVGSAVVLGGGIWSMHFVAMLAFEPRVRIDFDFHLTALSLLIAIVFVAIGFQMVTRPKPSIGRQLVAGAVVGCGVSAMHYTGMAAVILSGRVIYDPLLVAASIAIAIIAATVALWLTLNLTRFWQRIVAAVVMAIAVCGMHYTAMAATSFLCSTHLADSIDPLSRAIMAAAVSGVQFMILCLAMVCVFVDRRFEYLADREAEGLRAANQRLMTAQDATRNLLDNADQGFLTVDPDLVVEEQCSAACAVILGGPASGKSIVDLICGNARATISSGLRKTFESLFGETDEYMRDLKIGLLPTTAELPGKSIKVAYKYLPRRRRLMVILTNVTDATRLAQAVEREQQRLQMIVLALTEGETFFSLVEDYRKFLRDELPILVRLVETPGVVGDLKRRLHTFKGLLSQFSFTASPASLHELETRLDAGVSLDAGIAALLLTTLDEDLDNLLSVLGADFISSGRRIVISYQQLQRIRGLAQDILAGRADAAGTRQLAQTVVEIGYIDVKSAILLHSRSAIALAKRLGKELSPIQVTGDDMHLPSERFAEFFRSLVHVFRNAIDHGIETPEERLPAGKPVAGTIRCAVRRSDDVLEVVVTDDGRGVDRGTLEAKLLAAGAPPTRVNALSLQDILLCEGLSSREHASEVSGRGIGLAAVKTELDRLRGSLSVESTVGQGTCFRFALPICDAANAHVNGREAA